MQSGGNGLPCTDSFSGASLPLIFSATMPPLSVDAVGNLSLTLSSMTTVVSGSSAQGSLASWDDVDSALVQTYALMGVDMSDMLSLLPPPCTLQPLVLAQAQSPTIRALGVAMMAVESQVTGFLALGAELLISSIPQLTGGMSAAINLLSQKLVIQAQQQPITSSSLLTNAPFVTSVITAAFNEAQGSSGSTYQINLVSSVVASLSGPAELYRVPAVQVMRGGVPVRGLDVLSAFTTVAQMPAVQAGASAAVRQSVLSGSTQALLPYLPSGLPSQVQQVYLSMMTTRGR